ncbi:MAG: hypothetical protein RLY87_424 [Chloroflexota bacterium]|jgi:hypothetical protein
MSHRFHTYSANRESRTSYNNHTNVNQIIIPTKYKDIYSAYAGYANTILGVRSGRIVVLGSQTDGINVSRTPTKTATPTS